MAFVGLGLDGFDLSCFRRVYTGDMIGVDMGRANSACFGVTFGPYKRPPLGVVSWNTRNADE